MVFSRFPENSGSAGGERDRTLAIRRSAASGDLALLNVERPWRCIGCAVQVIATTRRPSLPCKSLDLDDLPRQTMV
jgi:hypothetical protein